MKISPPRSASLPAHESQGGTSVTYRRLPEPGAAWQWTTHPLPPLELERVLEATVVQRLPDERWLLDIDGVWVAAEDPGGLEVGQRLRLYVEQLQPQVVLLIVEKESAVDGEVARLWRTHVPFQLGAGASLDKLQKQLASQLEPRGAGNHPPSLRKLHDLVAGLLTEEAPSGAARVHAFINNSGLYYEAKLFRAVVKDPLSLREIANGDLKGLLLAALQELEAESISGELQSAIKNQLKNVESQQAINLLAQPRRGGFQVQIPLFHGSGFSTAAVSVEPDSKGSADEERQPKPAYNLLFLLDIESFGRIQIDVYLQAKSVRGIFYLDRDPALLFLRSEIPSFRKILEEIGYQDILLAAKPLKEIPRETQERFQALALGAPPKINLLDVKA